LTCLSALIKKAYQEISTTPSPPPLPDLLEVETRMNVQQISSTRTLTGEKRTDRTIIVCRKRTGQTRTVLTRRWIRENAILNKQAKEKKTGRLAMATQGWAGYICFILLIIGLAAGCQKNQEDEINTQIEKLHSSSRDVRDAAIDALVKIGAPAVDPLITSLKTNNQDIQASAARALGKIGDKRAIRPLINLLTKSFDIDLMFETVVALSSLDEQEACKELNRLKGESNPIIAQLAKKMLKSSELCK